MDSAFPSFSSYASTSKSFTEDLNELSRLQGVKVWGQHQDVLERQALEELQKFNQNKEDGELTSDEDEEIESVTRPVQLDISTYIKRQEELKKHQEYKRTLLVSEKSRAYADEISKQQSKSLKRKMKVKVKHSKKARVNNNDIEAVGKAFVDEGEGSTSGDKFIAGEVSEDGYSMMEEYHPGEDFANDDHDSDSDYVPSEIDSDCETGEHDIVDKERPPTKFRKKKQLWKINKTIDDGSVKNYNDRLEKYYDQLENENRLKAAEDYDSVDDEDIIVSPGFKIAPKVWSNLYSYQQEGLEWLWELHKKSSGGLLGDEMGLGKTVQIIAFLLGVHYSRVVSKHGRYTGLGPSIIICPSTVLHQWVKHFHDWAPEFRVAVLHQSGSFTGNKTQLIKDINKYKGIIVTTYQSILKYKGYLMDLDWHYIILDEGHKIRNPAAKVSVAVKDFRTPHRLILTGSPMQNNLQELWSLFDFIRPGMLGSLQVFMEHFASPIMQGGYMNATPMQEALALSMATALKNMITPYMLRRSKNDVQQDIALPTKTEQVLFCSLTPEQRDLYKGYLMSEQISDILGRGTKNWFSENHTRGNILKGITTLRKICNHPDIYINDVAEANNIGSNDENIMLEERYGFYKKSGKMVVVSALLKIWKRQKHRVLLFTQSRMMMSILRMFLDQQGYKYLKMDGTTPVAARQPLIDKFNKDTSFDVFVLTTKVGGLGVNLTGANRVIIYDPDWNPATDTQARERAWRIGQEKQVTIYRLLSAGTIEEKMYQRQVWKQLLSNKVLLDPQTQKCFKTSDLQDLFSLQEQANDTPETANIFKNSRVTMEAKIKEKKKIKHKSKPKDEAITFSDDKIEKMKRLAAQISKNISQTVTNEGCKKTEAQLELEEERQEKLEERKMLKQLTPIELRQHNRDKLNPDNTIVNEIDDFETDVSFTKALVISSKTAELYNEARTDKNKIDEATNEYSSLTKIFAKDEDKCKKKKKKKRRDKSVDTSGQVEGEKIEGLMRMEVKRTKMRDKRRNDEQDDYVLGKLFSKKGGVHTALQHDSIMQGGSIDRYSIRVHSETKSRTDIALQALKNSGVRAWR